MLSVSTDRSETDYARRFREAQRQRLKDAADRGFAVSQEEVPHDRGTLKQSGVPPTWTSDGELVWGYNAEHARAQEFGRDPYYPRVEPLLEWSRRVSGGESLGAYVAFELHPKEGMRAKEFAQAGIEAQRQYYRQHRLREYMQDTD